ncbi:MAG: SIMPL domain-containing protein [Elusimicrobiota bacterium]|jgi:hypothetical protein
MKRYLMALIALALAGAPLGAAEPDVQKRERSLTVQGQGKVLAVPDIATLSVEVSRDSADLDPALAQVRKEMTRVQEVIRAQGIEEKDIRTDQFQVHPKYDQDKRGNPHRAGYIVTNRVAVKVRDLKKTGKVLAVVLAAGATSVNGPDFEIDRPEALERLALAAAVIDAKAKAQAVAEAAGVELREIISINPQNIGWPGPRAPRAMMMAMAGADSMAAQEPIAAGEQAITGNVTVVYAIR